MTTRKAIFDACNRKNIEIEQHLVNNPEISKSEGTHKVRRLNFNNRCGVSVIKITEKNGSNHSVILVNDPHLKSSPDGWSIFDPNGYNPTRDFALGEILDDNNNDITQNYTEVSQMKGINFGTINAANPGYCGVYGILFMVYYHDNKNIPNWVQRWKTFLKYISNTDSILVYSQGGKTVRFPIAFDVAAGVQNIIHNNKTTLSGKRAIVGYISLLINSVESGNLEIMLNKNVSSALEKYKDVQLLPHSTIYDTRAIGSIRCMGNTRNNATQNTRNTTRNTRNTGNAGNTGSSSKHTKPKPKSKKPK